MPGEHWIAVGREPGRVDLVFDSFGRTPGPGWMPHLLGAAVTDTDPNQRLSDDNCGQISLGWGHVFIQHGYDVTPLTPSLRGPHRADLRLASP